LTIRCKSYPRAALIGNPSDGYHGKTIAFLFRNFSVDVELKESFELQLVPGGQDKLVYNNIQDLHSDVQSYGYYGGIRLLKATIKKFADYCNQNDITLPKQNFSLQYESGIPKRLGLAGSSAIITASLKAILQFYQLQIPLPLFANLVLSVETEELSIGAGLQDRVAQAYETPVYMDFDRQIMKQLGHGHYETLSLDLLPNLYIAYRTELAEGSEVLHNDLRERYDAGEMDVMYAMKRFAKLTSQTLEVLRNNQFEKLGPLMNENFDLRRSICDISAKNLEMVELARSLGASAKFTGSGGAIIGTYSDERMYEELVESFHSHQIEILKPDIVDQSES